MFFIKNLKEVIFEIKWLFEETEKDFFDILEQISCILEYALLTVLSILFDLIILPIELIALAIYLFKKG